MQRVLYIPTELPFLHATVVGMGDQTFSCKLTLLVLPPAGDNEPRDSGDPAVRGLRVRGVHQRARRAAPHLQARQRLRKEREREREKKKAKTVCA